MMSRKYLVLVLAGFLFAASAIFANIDEISCITQVREYLLENSGGHLIIFDLDNVTIHPANGVGSAGSDEWWTELIKTNQLLAPTKHINNIVLECLPQLHQAYMTVDSKLVQEEIISLFEHLRSEGFMIMGLTARSMQFAERTTLELLRLGVDFSTSFPVKNINSLKMLKNTCHMNGVLFCGIANKGEVLSCVLDVLECDPGHVIFIDDKEKNLQHVQECLNKKNISFQGLRYAYLDSDIQAWMESLNIPWVDKLNNQPNDLDY